jgi:hypothetical protein
LQSLTKTLRNHLSEIHYAENADPKHPTLKQSELEYVIDRDLKIVLAYLKAHGKVSHLMEMRLWYALSDIRKPYDFALKPSDKTWLDEVIATMTDEQHEDRAFPNPPTARLLYLITCLKDTDSITGADRQQDAYDYMMTHSQAFADREYGLYD